MKIPKKFYLYGFPITVKYSDKMEAWGQSLLCDNVILISTKINNREFLEQTFLHEVVHFVLHHSRVVNKYKLENGKELYLDEDFIDNVSMLLHQMFKTSEGVLKNK